MFNITRIRANISHNMFNITRIISHILYNNTAQYLHNTAQYLHNTTQYLHNTALYICIYITQYNLVSIYYGESPYGKFNINLI